ncbi:MAG TPA: RNA polymerase sigma factor [Polyangiaceae bacterium]|jgi:RNA polymerase sigma-70 factor (ECF subfamily)|nr:RNA polymerase sigma factor [Polyangiaceae bacterium]
MSANAFAFVPQAARVLQAPELPQAALVPQAPPPAPVRARPLSAPVVVAVDEHELHAGLVALVPRLRTRALRLCGDVAVADDIVQDTLERALRFSSQYERGTNLAAWAYQVLFSVFVTRWRRGRRERKALARLASDPCAWTVPASFAAPDVGNGAMTSATRRTLATLPAGFLAVVILVDLEQRSYQDAAAALGVPVGTVMSRLHRGRKLLASKFEKEAA